MKWFAAAVLVAIASLPSCRDFEQRARAVGARARDPVLASCVAESAKDDAGFERTESCADERCRAACAGGDVAKGFTATCVDECRARVTCATDADCATGMRCVAVAPRVRRCDAPTVP